MIKMSDEKTIELYKKKIKQLQKKRSKNNFLIALYFGIIFCFLFKSDINKWYDLIIYVLGYIGFGYLILLGLVVITNIFDIEFHMHDNITKEIEDLEKEIYGKEIK